MKKLLGIALAITTLALPAPTHAAVLIEQDTALTVVCKQKRPFRGTPFSISEPFITERFRRAPNTWVFLLYSTDPSSGEREDSGVIVRRLRRSNRWRLRVPLPFLHTETGDYEPARWRGCR